MGLMKEFREFAMRGNVVDLAVGVIIGGAFGKIVSSLVSDIIMPPIGMLMKGQNFADLFMSLDGNTYESIAKAKEAGAPVLAYGSFLQTVLDFIIVAFAIFMMIKGMNRLNKLKKKEEEAQAAAAAEPEPTKEQVLLTEIRDLLKK
ncbi:MAG TPA: large-conductance mechanosensitive channel protein MscL [Flavobacteriales bacterium]|nr:large conductance mechanosensitive channel protein MscL [Flavobacteriales bacterium]HRE74591.1 large-conductance mechanosensitive channel protein MscL [Flavobacteriales bacterium]HRE98069.1 large-conductance mechanosensitive channel protein MscL [Flavobacteriales bacterium]HRJ36065.1 large-conductance mechanosensitive channel protein MscL [Flavobacteriales bacterium]HRJ39927.1 large-conductance mechanosensitive channel protein MscL [Flavobacteriales bacterium]